MCSELVWACRSWPGKEAHEACRACLIKVTGVRLPHLTHVRVNTRALLVRLPLEAVMITCIQICVVCNNMHDACIIDHFYLFLLRAIFLAA